MRKSPYSLNLVQLWGESPKENLVIKAYDLQQVEYYI